MGRIFYFLILSLVAAVPSLAAIEIKELKTPSGITVWYVPEPAIPTISLSIGFKGGPSLDPADKLGATYVMTSLLEEGAGDFDAVEFVTKLEELSTSFEFNSGLESVTIKAQFLKKNTDQSVELLRAAIQNPHFEETAFERVRRQVASSVNRRQTNPNDIAGEYFNQTAYPDHAYGRPYQGRPETIAALTPADMRDAHARVVARDRLYIGAVGDFSEEELANIVDRLFADLPETGAAFPEPITFQAPSETHLIEFEGPQSVAIWGHEGIAQDDPDFFPAFVMNKVLGAGGFGSRLTEEVRVKRGLTYGISSYLASRDRGQYYGGQVASANETIAEAIEVVRAEWQRMAEEGVTDEELEAAKKNMTGSYVLRFDGNAQIASILRYSQMENFPIDYPQNRNSYIEAVTKEDIARVAKRILRDNDLFFVVIGQPDDLNADLKK